MFFYEQQNQKNTCLFDCNLGVADEVELLIDELVQGDDAVRHQIFRKLDKRRIHSISLQQPVRPLIHQISQIRRVSRNRRFQSVCHRPILFKKDFSINGDLSRGSATGGKKSSKRMSLFFFFVLFTLWNKIERFKLLCIRCVGPVIEIDDVRSIESWQVCDSSKTRSQV